MSVKRKRSNPSLFANSSFETTQTPFSSSPTRLPDFFAQSKAFEPQTPLSWKQQISDSSLQDEERTPQLNSRTRKRYRDGRPDEAEIHASTVQRLFSAQRAHLSASPLLSQPQESQMQQSPPQPANQKSTLHSFWQLPQQTAQHGGLGYGPQQEPLRCEDCDRGPVVEETMNIAGDAECRSCGRTVCDTCAVAAEVRLCLGCATRG